MGKSDNHNKRADDTIGAEQEKSRSRTKRFEGWTKPEGLEKDGPEASVKARFSDQIV